MATKPSGQLPDERGASRQGRPAHPPPAPGTVTYVWLIEFKPGWKRSPRLLAGAKATTRVTEKWGGCRRAGGKVPCAAMSDIVRFTISLESDLLEAFDRFVQQGKFATRSEAIRQLIHDVLTRQAWASAAGQASGILTLVYDHHRTQVQQKLVQLQHDSTDCVVATLHVHLDHDLCMEAIALCGQPSRLQEIASELRGIKGVHKGELVMASAHRH